MAIKSYKEILPQITTFIFDVDGVLTDGTVALHSGDFVRTLNSKDGYAIQFAAKNGYRLLAITGGTSPSVETRLLSLGFSDVRLRAINKLDVYEEMKSIHGFQDNEVMYMGDDIPDYHVMTKVALAASPQDAAVEIKSISHYHSPYIGGHQCVRDIIEQTLRVQGKWFNDLAHEW